MEIAREGRITRQRKKIKVREEIEQNEPERRKKGNKGKKTRSKTGR